MAFAIGVYGLLIGAAIHIVVVSMTVSSGSTKLLQLFGEAFRFAAEKLKIWAILCCLGLALGVVILSVSDFSNNYTVAWPTKLFSAVSYVLLVATLAFWHFMVCVFCGRKIANPYILAVMSASIALAVFAGVLAASEFVLPKAMVWLATGETMLVTTTHYIPLHGYYLSAILTFIYLKKVRSA